MTCLPILLALLLPAQVDPYPVIDPYAVTSPDGRWHMRVEPGDRFGVGPSTLRALCDGEVQAEIELPFTFEVAAITDSGYCVGHGRTSTESDGELVIAVIAPDGTIAREERFQRTF